MILFIFVLLLIFIIISELYRKKRLRFDYLSLYNLYFLLIYIIPAILLAFDFQNSASKYVLVHINQKIRLETVIAILMSYVLVTVGFYLKSSKELGSCVIIKYNKNVFKDIQFVIFLLVLSILSIYTYSNSYGGIINTIALASDIRAGIIVADKFAFTKHFILASIFSLYIIYCLLYIYNIKVKRKLLYILLGISIIIIIISLFVFSGRGAIINIFVVLLLVNMLVRKKVGIIKMVSFFLIVYTVSHYGDRLFISMAAYPNSGVKGVVSVFKSLEIGGKDYTIVQRIYDFFKNFQFAIISLDVSFKNIDTMSFRFFVDWIYIPITLIPTKLFNIKEFLPKSISVINTYYIVGIYAKTVPPGYIAYGIYSLSWFGLFFYSFIYGWVLRFVQSIIINNIKESYIMYLLYVVIGMWLTSGFLNGDPQILIRGAILLIIFIYYVLIYSNNIKIFKRPLLKNI
jgi:hypothetical protein